MITAKDDVVSNRDTPLAARRDFADRIAITAKLDALAGRAVRVTQESVAAYHAFENLKTARGNGVLVPMEQKQAAQERQMAAFRNQVQIDAERRALWQLLQRLDEMDAARANLDKFIGTLRRAHPSLAQEFFG